MRRHWRALRSRMAQVNRQLADKEREIVDMAKRLSRLEAEAEYAERAAQRRRQR